MSPRRVIGTVDTSEFLVAVAASIGFFIGIGSENIPWSAVGALLVGGLIAAPIAAYLVRHVPARLLGVSVGGIIILTNTRTLLNAFEVSNSVRPSIYATHRRRSGWCSSASRCRGCARTAARSASSGTASSPPPPDVDHASVINGC